MALVLCTGSDKSLLETRRMLMEHAGHTVVPATDIRDVEQACRQHRFDVAVIGQGVAAPEKRRLFDVVRRYCPAARILELHLPVEGRSLPAADDWLQVPAAAPAELAERVSTLGTKSEKRFCSSPQ